MKLQLNVIRQISSKDELMEKQSLDKLNSNLASNTNDRLNRLTQWKLNRRLLKKSFAVGIAELVAIIKDGFKLTKLIIIVV